MRAYLIIFLLELSTVFDNDLGTSGTRTRSNALDGTNNVHSLDDGSEDDVLPIQPTATGRCEHLDCMPKIPLQSHLPCLRSAQKELRSVGVGAGVGHTQDSRAGVLELEVLVGELVTIN